MEQGQGHTWRSVKAMHGRYRKNAYVHIHMHYCLHPNGTKEMWKWTVISLAV